MVLSCNLIQCCRRHRRGVMRVVDAVVMVFQIRLLSSSKFVHHLKVCCCSAFAFLSTDFESNQKIRTLVLSNLVYSLVRLYDGVEYFEVELLL